MSMVHAGKQPALHRVARRIAGAVEMALRWLLGTSGHRSVATDPDDLKPSRMSRTSLAAELLATSGPLSIHDIPAAAGIGVAPPKGTLAEATLARKLAVARELLCRDLRAQLQDRPMMDKPELLIDWLRLHCASLDYEVFFLVHLSVQYRIIDIEPIYRGTLTTSTVHPREVVKSALAHQSAAVALAHNHPHGDPKPSTADQFLTATLKSALALVDVRVLDHFVIAGAQHYSFAEHGLL